MDSTDVPSTKPRILLVSKGILQPGLLARVTLNSILFQDRLFRFSGVSSLDRLPDLLMEKIQAIVLYARPRVVSAEALEWLTSYVNQGGGLLALHPALSALANYPQYSTLLGGRLLNSGRAGSLTMEPEIPDDPIFTVRVPFIIRDAAVTLGLDPSNTVHFYARYKDEQIPYIWSRTVGNGRICGCAIGETASGLRHPDFQAILHQALVWCSGVNLALFE